MKEVVVLAGSTPWSVLAFCMKAKRLGVHTRVVCADEKYRKKLASNIYVDDAELCFNQNLIDFLLNHQDFPAREDIMLVPTTDVLCRILADNFHKLENRFLIGMTSPEMVETFTDKRKAHLAAQAAGLLCPQSVILSLDDYNESLMPSFSFPVIVKPLDAASHKLLGFKFKILSCTSELNVFVKSLADTHSNLICQEYIPGEDSSCLFYVFYRTKDGMLFSCQGEKTLQSNGIMTVGTTKVNDRLSTVCEEFLSKTGYYGLGGIEFKVYDDNYYFIEMSTRSEGFLPVADMSGVPIIDAVLGELTGDMPEPCGQENGVRYIAGLGWLIHRLRTKALGTLFTEFFSFVFSSKSHFVEHYVGWRY